VDFCSAIDASTLPAIYLRPGINSEEAIAMDMQPWLSKLQPGREVRCGATEAEAAASTELVYRYVAVADGSSCTDTSSLKTVDGNPKIGLIRSDKFCLYPKWQLEANGSEIQEMVQRWEELKFDPVNKEFRYKLQWALPCFKPSNKRALSLRPLNKRALSLRPLRVSICQYKDQSTFTKKYQHKDQFTPP
jgi:hypothetical protein